MNSFSRLSFHHRIFVLIGLFVVISVAVMWIFIRPLYERQVVEERTTVVQQLQHFAVRSIDEKLEQWITIAQYLGWNLETRPNDVGVLIRQQIAFDTSLIQIIVTSPELSDEFVATSSGHSSFSFAPDKHSWIELERDSSISILWVNDTAANQEVFGVQKRIFISNKPIFLTLFADSKYLLHQLKNLPIGGSFAVQVGGEQGFIFSNASIKFPVTADSWQHLTVTQNVRVENTDWMVLFSKFSTVPMYLMIGIPKEVIVQPVQNLLFYSTIVLIGLTIVVGVFGWIFSRQLSAPVTQLVHDVERLKTLDFSQPVSIPKLREIASIATTIESMRTVLERYQRINVEKIIFEEWKNKFFLSHSEDGISITDGSGMFTFMNARFQQITAELQRSSPIRMKDDLFSHSNIERSKESFREEPSGPYLILFHQKEIKINVENGEPLFFRMHDVTISRDKENFGSLIVLHDLTNDRMIEKTKTEMINFIAHELKNPLNSVMGFSSMIMEEENMSKEEQLQFADIIYKSSKTMNELINRFLNVQRLESHSVEYHKETTDLVALAKFVCVSQQPQLDAKSLTLNFTAGENIPAAMVSPDLMREAFVNLVSNAVKYGDEHRTINVEMKRNEKTILFIITDHGYGISAEDQQKLFSKFFRVTSNEKAAKQLGTGLGLAHVKEVMKYHHGEVSLESSSEIGCRFTLTIPIE